MKIVNRQAYQKNRNHVNFRLQRDALVLDSYLNLSHLAP